MARWVRRRDRAGRVLAIPNQQRGALARYGVSREDADRSAWTIEADGKRSEGAAAMNRVLRQMGGGWSTLARAYDLRPVASVEEVAYRWFAANRSRFARFGASPECDERGADCE
jgi:predicted DCC family thiol-disulfide oxidoreductase YuxK